MKTFEEKGREKYHMPEVSFAPNSKPPFFLRIITTLIDTALMIMVGFGVHALIFISPMYNPIRNYETELYQIQDRYALETGFGEKVTITEENKDQYTGYITYVDEDNSLYVVSPIENPSEEIVTSYKNAVTGDSAYADISFKYSLAGFGYVCLSGFISELIFIFIIPLTNKRRATIGQLFAGLQVISVKYQDKATWYQLTGRFIFVFLIDSVLPYLILGNWLMLVVPILVVVIAAINHKSNRALQDLISGTFIIHKKSFSPLKEDEETVVEEKPSQNTPELSLKSEENNQKDLPDEPKKEATEK